MSRSRWTLKFGGEVVAVGDVVRGIRVLWLLPDNLDADTRRRLRVRLNAGVPSGK